MASIKALYKRVKALRSDEVIQQTLEEKKEDYLDENRKQLYEGFDREGNRLRKYRSAKYARVKNQMNPRPGLGNPDFYVTGAFYRNRTVTVQGGELITNLNDPKSEDLLKRDPDIIGLGGPYKIEFMGMLHPALINNFRSKLRL